MAKASAKAKRGAGGGGGVAAPAIKAAPAVPPTEEEVRRQRQVVHWRTLAAVFGLNDQAPNVELMAGELVQQLGMPQAVLDPAMGIDTLLQRFPELKDDFAAMEAVAQPEDAEVPSGEGEAVAPREESTEPQAPATPAAGLRRSVAYSKLLLNVFGPTTRTATVTAQQYNQWCNDVARFERCFGYGPGQLRGKRGGPGQGQEGDGTGGHGGNGGGPGASATGTGGGHHVSEEMLKQGLAGMEGDLVKRMALREVLQNDQMAASLTPSMPLLEQLLRDKANLSGNALKNARALIRQYVDELAEVLRLQVMRAVRGKIDRSVAPKRVYRNLDLKRTLWKNLKNFNPRDGRLYVDQLYYRQTAKKSTPVRMVVVVDQSGSMVDAMVQCTILASIFATLPRVDMHLMAFDTNVLDLTEYVHDPFEVLLRTNLGGGTLIRQALIKAAEKIEEPRNTAVVLISDFYEGGSDQELLDYIKQLRDSGVHFIPVGAVTSSGYFSVHDWFRTKLKEMGTPILTGNIRKLIEELKNLL